MVAHDAPPGPLGRWCCALWRRRLVLVWHMPAWHHRLLASSPPLLVLVLVAEAVLLAPLVTASLHLRFATALTLISSQVVILCQVEATTGVVLNQPRFVAARLVQVGSLTMQCQ